MSKNENLTNQWRRTTLLDQIVEKVCTPYYRPTNKSWEITFRALGFTRSTVEDFWSVFYRINKARDGNITILEFLNYFNLERSTYIEKCFDYFDVTGEGNIDFLEFMVSVWNICTLNVDTLTRFTFDIYNLNEAGELSLPEIERMVQELYGNKLSLDSIGRDVLKDINHFTELRGGVLNLTSFTIYTSNHSLLLLPVFRIQRKIQNKIMGMNYWRNVERNRPDTKKLKHEDTFDARYAKDLLRKYKEGGLSAMLTHCGDPDDTLLQLYQKKERGEETKIEIDESNIKNKKFKTAVKKVQKINREQKARLRTVVLSAKRKSRNTIDAAGMVLLDAGVKSRQGLSRLASSLTRSFIASEEYHVVDEIADGATDSEATLEQNREALTSDVSSQIIFNQNETVHKTQLGKVVSQTPRHKKRRPRPKTAPSRQRSGLLKQQSAGGMDHRHFQSRMSRPRTPGTLVYAVKDQHTSFN